MLFVIASTVFFLYKIIPEEDRKFLISLFVIGICLRIVIFAAIYLILISNGYSGEFTEDSRLYFLRALCNLRLFRAQTEFPFIVEGMVGQNGYLHLLSAFFYIIGYNPVLFNPISIFSDKLINCLIGSATGILIYYIAKEIFSKKVAIISSIFAVFYPGFFMWSMTDTREPSNIFLVSLIIFSLVRFQRLRSKNYLFIVVLSGLALFSIRLYVFLTVAIVVLLSLMFLYRKEIKRFIPLLVIIFVLISLAVNLFPRGRLIFDKYLSYDGIIGKLHLANDGILSSGGPIYKIYDEGLAADEAPRGISFFKTVLKGTIYFMFLPFPWSITSKTQLAVYPQVIIWYFMVPFTILGILFSIKYRFKESFTLLVYLILVTSMFSLVEGNIASAVRHRDLVLIFCFIFSSVGIVRFFGIEEQ